MMQVSHTLIYAGFVLLCLSFPLGMMSPMSQPGNSLKGDLKYYAFAIGFLLLFGGIFINPTK